MFPCLLLLFCSALIHPASALTFSGGGGATRSSLDDVFNILAHIPWGGENEAEGGTERLNLRPIIGILAEDIPSSLTRAFPEANASSYVGASYVKWVESAGARAAPVLLGRDVRYYREEVFDKMNGLLIPGGGVSLFNSAYARAAKILFDMAKSAPPLSRQDFPIWGTCLGFEQLAVLTANPSPGANSSSLLTACDSENQRGSVRVKRRREWRRSDIGRDMPRNVFRVLEGADRPIFNSHHKCLTPGAFHSQGLGRFWRLLATDFDKNGLEFVTLMEAKGGLPVWGSQFHPEKPLFEWAERLDQLPHDRAAVQVNGYLADFFVSRARKSRNRFPDREAEESVLFYNYPSRYAGKKGIDFPMQQVYLF